MKFVWHNGYLALEENGKFRFIYQCLPHKDFPMFARLLIPSATVFAKIIPTIPYPKPPYTQAQAAMEFDIRPILCNSVLQLKMLPWNPAFTVSSNLIMDDFDFGERDRLGEPGVNQFRYKYTQLYIVEGNDGYLDLRKLINEDFGIYRLWDFVIPKVDGSDPYPPVYGP
jgi:hypothetical protein